MKKYSFLSTRVVRQRLQFFHFSKSLSENRGKGGRTGKNGERGEKCKEHDRGK
jgi:hypothetical protein